MTETNVRDRPSLSVSFADGLTEISWGVMLLFGALWRSTGLGIARGLMPAGLATLARLISNHPPRREERPNGDN